MLTKRFLFKVGCLLSGCLVMLAAGCNSPTENRYSGHFVPPHRPTDFGAAVDRIEELFMMINNGEPSFDWLEVARADEDFHESLASKIPRDSFEELAAIIGWLPELAADSDLYETEWLTVKRLSDQMSTSMSEILQHPPGSRMAQYRTICHFLEKDFLDLAPIRNHWREIQPKPQEDHPADHELESSEQETNVEG